MPNQIDVLLRREKERKQFREYWKKDTKYKARKLQENRDYVNSSFDRMQQIYVRRRIKLGLIPMSDIINLTGIKLREILELRRAGVISQPIRLRAAWRCYSVEQVACLTLAKQKATIVRAFYTYIDKQIFHEYLKANWPEWEKPDV
jgi:hypothetical protein